MPLVIVLNVIIVPALLERLAAPPIDCTFAHPRYAGECVEQVTPAAKQTPVQACRVVLNCLNDVRCVRTYCRATSIRGGWTLVSPKEKDRRRPQ